MCIMTPKRLSIIPFTGLTHYEAQDPIRARSKIYRSLDTILTTAVGFKKIAWLLW